MPSLESSELTVNLQVLTPGAPHDVHLDDGKGADGDRVAFCKRLFDAGSHLLAVEHGTVGVVEEAYDVGAGRLPDDQQVPAGDTVVAFQSDGPQPGAGASGDQALFVVERKLPRWHVLRRFDVGLVEGDFNLNMCGSGGRRRRCRRGRGWLHGGLGCGHRLGYHVATLPGHEVVATHTTEGG